jgi:hypothetical protein
MSYPYTLVAYKSSGSSSCRGCETDRWDSELDVGQFETYEAACNYAFSFVKKDAETSDESNWDLTLYSVSGEESYYPNSHSEDNFSVMMHSMYKTYRHQYEAAQLLTRAKKEQQRIDDQKQRDLETLKRLQDQYGETK